MAKIVSFTKPVLQQLRGDIDALLAKYAAEHGLNMELGKIKFSDAEFNAELKVKIEGAKTFTDEILESRMNALGLKKDGIGGRTLFGYNTKAYGYPFQYEQGGKKYKCSEEQAVIYFKA